MVPERKVTAGVSFSLREKDGPEGRMRAGMPRHFRILTLTRRSAPPSPGAPRHPLPKGEGHHATQAFEAKSKIVIWTTVIRDTRRGRSKNLLQDVPSTIDVDHVAGDVVILNQENHGVDDVFGRP